METGKFAFHSCSICGYINMGVDIFRSMMATISVNLFVENEIVSSLVSIDTSSAIYSVYLIRGVIGEHIPLCRNGGLGQNTHLTHNSPQRLQ